MPNPLRSCFVLATVLWTAIALQGCGGGGGGTVNAAGAGGGPGGGEVPLPAAMMLNWVAPSTYVDNTPLSPATELEVFEVFVNQSGIFTDNDAPVAFVAAVDNVTGQVVDSFNLVNLAPYLSRGVAYKVSLRAVATTGMKSAFSSSASFSF